MITILIVEDDPNTRLGLGEILSDEGFDVHLAADAEIARSYNAQDFDIVLSDLHLPGKDGLELLTAMKRENPTLATIIMTAYSTTECYIEGRRLGVDAWLTKPLNIESLVSLLGRVRLHNGFEPSPFPEPEAVVD